MEKIMRDSPQSLSLLSESGSIPSSASRDVDGVGSESESESGIDVDDNDEEEALSLIKNCSSSCNSSAFQRSSSIFFTWFT
ncbi:hypothetical protein C0J52_11647 [Blattella germanica]|nr:hypothetical protein C0J52_11647 [Blattella germanica]